MDNFSVRNFGTMISDNKLVLNSTEGKTSFISVKDIAYIIEKTLFNDKTGI